MKVVHPLCCGLDVHKAQVTACLRRDRGGGVVSKQTRVFDTTLSQLEALRDWLVAEGCKVAAMESTGVYWKPVYHVLSKRLDVLVGNPRDMRRRGPGRKTDKADADWISELVAHGLVQPSFIPPPHITALRDLTRTRATLVQTRTQAKNRVHKVLEDTNIKLASVVSDLFGKSARMMLDALIAGERDPKRLAQMALGVMRRKIPQLEFALAGQFTEHHAALIRMSLEQVDMLERQIGELDQRIEQLSPSLGAAVEQGDSIPGVDEVAARTILAEIGTDMSRFGSSKRLASWGGLCPGNNESAGKRLRGKARKGNRWLNRVLNQCAWAARKTDSFLGRRFRTLQARIGGKKAAKAIAHQILVIFYHLLKDGTFYDEEHDLRTNPRQEARWRNNAVRTLERLGYNVSLQPAAA